MSWLRVSQWRPVRSTGISFRILAVMHDGILNIKKEYLFEHLKLVSPHPNLAKFRTGPKSILNGKWHIKN